MNRDDLMSHQKAINQEMSVEELGTGRWTFRSPLNDMGKQKWEMLLHERHRKTLNWDRISDPNFPRGRKWSIKPQSLEADAPLHWSRTVARLGSRMGLHTRPGSHIPSFLLMQTRTSPHMQRGWPLFWKRSVQIRCLVTPTCPGFHFPCWPLSGIISQPEHSRSLPGQLHAQEHYPHLPHINRRIIEKLRVKRHYWGRQGSR